MRVTFSIFEIYLIPSPKDDINKALVPFNNNSAVGNYLVPSLSFNRTISIPFNVLSLVFLNFTKNNPIF